MKAPLFVANTVSAILLLNLMIKEPSITGFVVASTTPSLTLVSPLGLSSIFVIGTLVLDVVYYSKNK